MPLIRLDPDAGPASQQVRAQLADLIASGGLRPGDKLPTVRGLAAELGVSPATVARAYRELEAEGLTTTATRAGTVVRDPRAAGDDAAARRAATHLATAAVAAGLDDEAALTLLRGALLLARRPWGRPTPGRPDDAPVLTSSPPGAIVSII